MSIAVVDLLQELTDIDTLHESEEGAEVLIDALVSGSSFGVLGVGKVLTLALPLCTVASIEFCVEAGWNR